MQQDVVIRSGRKDFVLLERFVEIGSSHVVGYASFQQALLYEGIEALAQLGAYHVRYLTDFSRHAFLLKIADCPLPFGSLNGRYRLDGNLTGRAASSFSYDLSIDKAEENRCAMKGRFLFAAVDYDERFRKDVLEKHYRKVFKCLQGDIEIGC